MACNCNVPTPPQNSKFRKALIIALLLNLSLFIIEVFGGYLAHSAALWADALDFFGDSVNYFISLMVLSMGLYWRSTVALLKGIVMCLFGVFVLAKVLYAYQTGTIPEPIAMGAIAILALIANLVCAFILYAFRDGDSNMQSVWLCSRNDAIGNIAVVFAALGVFGTGSLWPDLIVALIMAFLGVSAGYKVVKLAYAERQLAKRKFCNSTQG